MGSQRTARIPAVAPTNNRPSGRVSASRPAVSESQARAPRPPAANSAAYTQASSRQPNSAVSSPELVQARNVRFVSTPSSTPASQQRAKAGQPRREPQPQHHRHHQGQTCRREAQREPVGGHGRLDAQHAPDEIQQHHPQKARVALHRPERRRVPRVAQPQLAVAHVAIRDVRVVALEPEQPPARVEREQSARAQRHAQPELDARRHPDRHAVKE